MISKILILFAALNGLGAVAIGAASRHLLAGDPHRAELALTGVRYGLPHATALLALGALALSSTALPRHLLNLAGASLALGTTLFAFSLYLLALGAPAGIAIVTPIGGALMILGWAILLTFGAVSSRSPK